MALSSVEMMEIGFNITYLIVIYIIVYLMWINKKSIPADEHRIGTWFLRAFFLLALGDTGHVGFRVVAYALGGLEQNQVLVGLGSLSTAITIGIFYMIYLEIWRVRFEKPMTLFYYIILAIGVIRLLMFPFPQNDWGSLIPPKDWSLVRNVPLMIQGVTVAILFLYSGSKSKDKFFTNIALWTFVSYAFYIPVILFVQEVPMIGMLMIPKTIAYVIMAWLAYKRYFNSGDILIQEEKPVAVPVV